MTLDVTTITDLYITQKLPLLKVANILGVGYKKLWLYMERNNIPRRSTSDACRGVSKSETTKAKMKEFQNKPESKKRLQENWMGSNNPNWTGNPKDFLNSIRKSTEGRKWRNSVFERDSYTCQCCGDNKGGNLEADHIIPLSFIVKKHSIQTLQEAFTCKELWNIENGRTLCKECHKLTDTWGPKAISFNNS